MKSINLISHLHPGLTEAGCDEAGRGPLAGPVYAAAVILPENFHHPLLNDSKKMTEKSRCILREIIEKEALYFSVKAVGAEEIDEMNILNASIEGMHRALKSLGTKPDYILVDGNRFRPLDGIPYECIVKGDGKFASIAAASVLAKTFRDEFMIKIAKEYPEYGWDRNMGYPTKEHLDAIRKFGVTPYHRKSFRPVSDFLHNPTLF